MIRFTSWVKGIIDRIKGNSKEVTEVKDVPMKISKKGLDLIKEFEGFEAYPYRCPAGVPTVGYGTTYYPSGRRVKLNDRPVTKAEAVEMLRYQIDTVYGKAVNDVALPATQNQFDALTSFAYNVGSGALRSSTLLMKHNLANYTGAASEFKRWSKGRGRVLAGLVRRRAAEAALYNA